MFAWLLCLVLSVVCNLFPFCCCNFNFFFCFFCFWKLGYGTLRIRHDCNHHVTFLSLTLLPHFSFTWYTSSSLHSLQWYSQIFVLGHKYLFLRASTFLWALLSENCPLLAKINNISVTNGCLQLLWIFSLWWVIYSLVY